MSLRPGMSTPCSRGGSILSARMITPLLPASGRRERSHPPASAVPAAAAASNPAAMIAGSVCNTRSTMTAAAAVPAVAYQARAGGRQEGREPGCKSSRAAPRRLLRRVGS